MFLRSAIFPAAFCIAMNTSVNAQTHYGSEPLAHTYSIVARDSVTGEMGVAVQSHWFSVGSVVSWGEAGTGVVATQSFVNVSFGIRGLALLKNGLSPQQALDSLLSGDEGRAVRQVAILNVKGDVAVHTGDNCIADAGHRSGRGYSVQANMMLNDKVPDAMALAFESAKGPLAERMMAALEAAQAAGGDIRGKQSAAILVVKGESTGKVWEDRLIDLRVEDHAEPLLELRRLLRVYRAYEHMNRGDLAMEKGEMDAALKEYSAAETLYAGNEEMKYWHAVTRANKGDLQGALPLFRAVFEKNNNWMLLTERIHKQGLLQVDAEALKLILQK